MIFDFDGTLLDTFPAIAAGFNAALQPIFGRTYTDAEVVAHFGPPDEGMIAKALAAHPREVYEQAVERYFTVFEKADRDIEIFEGILPMLDELSARGVPLGIMTGKGRRAAEITLSRIGWKPRFGVIITGDDTRAPKPDPEGILLAARELDVASQNCIYVGDSPADVQAAHAAGMKAVVAGWHGFYRAELEKLAPDFWANTPVELGQWLNEELEL